MVVDIKQRYLKDFVRVGRSGKHYYVFGAPNEWYGPHSSVKEAEKAYSYIVDHFEEFEIINRKIHKKG